MTANRPIDRRTLLTSAAGIAVASLDDSAEAKPKRRVRATGGFGTWTPMPGGAGRFDQHGLSRIIFTTSGAISVIRFDAIASLAAPPNKKWVRVGHETLDLAGGSSLFTETTASIDNGTAKRTVDLMGFFLPAEALATDVRLDGRSEEHTSELQSHSDLVC